MNRRPFCYTPFLHTAAVQAQRHACERAWWATRAAAVICDIIQGPGGPLCAGITLRHHFKRAYLVVQLLSIPCSSVVERPQGNRTTADKQVEGVFCNARATWRRARACSVGHSVPQALARSRHNTVGVVVDRVHYIAAFAPQRRGQTHARHCRCSDT